MSCIVTAPGGANKDCIAYLSEAQAAIITDPSFSWADVGAVDNIENLRVLLRETRKGFIVEFNGTEPTNAEPVTETTGFGDNIITAENTPSLLAYAEMNACDFKEILSAYKGGSYNVAFVLGDGTIMLADKLTSLAGFKTQVFAHRFGVPGRENQTQQFRITFNFLKGEEFDNYKAVPVNYTIDEVADLIPLGLQADINTAYNTGTGVIVLDVYTRCVVDSLKAGTMTAELDKGTKGLVITATPTDDGNGQYTVTVLVGGATQLAAGEYAIFRLVSKTGLIYEEISNAIKVVG
jgi:hypothetical protein